MTETAQRRLDQIRNMMVNPSDSKGLSANRSELSPIKFFTRSCRTFPNNIAMIEEGGAAHTYHEFGLAVRRLGHVLRAKFGVQPGDRVALVCRNIPVALMGQFAIPLAGGVIVAINTRLNLEEMAFIVEHSGAKLVIYEEALDLGVPATSASWVAATEVDLAISELKDKEIDPAWDGFLEEPQLEDEVMSITYTSGTTGRPKGVMSTYRGITLVSLSNVMELVLTKDSRYLWTLPLFHCSGWYFPYAVAAVAGASVLLKKPDPELVWHHFKNSKITHYCGSPTVQIAIANHPQATKLPHPVTTLVGGSPPFPSLIKQLEHLNIYPIHGYGLSETYGPTSIEYSGRNHYNEDRYRLMARQGHANLLAGDIRVVTSTMEDVPRDGQAMGEVVFRGNLVMKGYYNDPAATDRAFTGGWFHSGDLAVMERDGSIRLQDREKDLIISGGENISTFEVEATIAAHPEVLEVAVVSSPHPRWGETPKAFVVLKRPLPPPSSSSGTIKEKCEEKLAQELLAFTREKLAHFKCPGKWAFVPVLPKTGTGKVMKFQLRADEWKHHNQRIG